MDVMRPILTAALVLSAGLTAQAAEPPEDPVSLEPMIVMAPIAPLDRSLILLRLLVERSTPCLGCDAVLRTPRAPAAARLLSYLLMPTEPPPVGDSERLLFEIKLADSPELEFLRP